MHVLIADKLPPMAVSDLEAAGIEVTLQPTLKDDALTDAIASTGAEVLIVRSTKVTAAMLEAGRLGLVVRAGAGTNTIDIAAASAGGIYVANCPGKNSLAVAELAIGFLVALDRRIPDATAQLRAGQWNKKEFSKARGLAGRTLGVVGAGRIGLAVAERALALGMKVLVHDRSPSRAGAVTELGARFESNLRGMLGHCDAISLHAPGGITCPSGDSRFGEHEQIYAGYVGVTGIGAPSPVASSDHPEAGIWGYDRRTSTSEITAGLANTLLLIEAELDRDVWLLGGRPTTRWVSDDAQQIGVGKNFGGFHEECGIAGMADGRAVKLSNSIDRTILARMVQIHSAD